MVGAVEREGLGRAEIRDRLSGLAGAERLEFFSMPRIDVSSTLIRSRLADGLPIRYLVPDGVAAVIGERGLYQPPPAASGRRGERAAATVAGAA